MVFFQPGATWRAVQVYTRPGVTYSAYGEGEKPGLVRPVENGGERTSGPCGTRGRRQQDLGLLPPHAGLRVHCL